MYNALKSKISLEFPELEFSADDEKKEIIIPEKNTEIGAIYIQYKNAEFHIFLGHFTHWHAGRDYGDTGNVEKDIVKEIIKFLEDLFEDKIFMWGSNSKGGGFMYIDKDFKTEKDGYVWSGRYGS